MKRIMTGAFLVALIFWVVPAAAEEESSPSGGELYAQHCGRCHEPRPPAERTDREWKTLLLHMRVRTNLPGKDARKILEFMQAMN